MREQSCSLLLRLHIEFLPVILLLAGDLQLHVAIRYCHQIVVKHGLHNLWCRQSHRCLELRGFLECFRTSRAISSDFERSDDKPDVHTQRNGPNPAKIYRPCPGHMLGIESEAPFPRRKFDSQLFRHYFDRKYRLLLCLLRAKMNCSPRMPYLN